MKCKKSGRRFIALAAGGVLGGAATTIHAGVTANVLYAISYPLYRDGPNQATGNYQMAALGQVVGYGTSPDFGLNNQENGGNNYHAYVWNGSTSSAVDLNPSGYTESFTTATNGSQQVGYGYGTSTANNDHAQLWSGSPIGAVDLNPTTGFTSSVATGVGGSQQVGYGLNTSTGLNHAMLWTGSASSAIDLNPNGYTSSEAYATNGVQQVGYAANYYAGTNDAVLWNGSAGSYVDLGTDGFTYSYALGTSGTQQVGYGVTSLSPYTGALLWNGSAGSAVNLNPSTFSSSVAVSTNGTMQVGYGETPSAMVGSNQMDALLWSGTADSYIDLGSLLPAVYTASAAYTISGNTIYGVAFDNANDVAYAVSWTVSVPEPVSLPLIAIAGAGLLGSRRVRRSRAGIRASVSTT